MLQNLPDLIYPLRFARSRRNLRGRVALARMHRLRPLLAAERGYVEVNLRFGADHWGRLGVRGEARAELHLTCQRCLGVMLCRVESDIRLNMIFSEDQMDRPTEYLSPGFEPLVITDDETGMILSDLIEDELILMLPSVPRHPDGACKIAGGYLGGESTQNEQNKSFAALEGLMEYRG
uniref:Large ribosomal RNA subunit accumulation protein YceD n=1 Tax=Candidatus Kentrum sp. LPFa TaxID=2126335 RepID=A0A450WPM3_9GAMM|nr:MAG: uncharacterized protein BECKLPF1236B_GA0070989_11582 [Candidatus Kentron sp. LPFa]